MQQHSLTAVLLAAIVLGAGTPCGASEVSYVETFDATPFRWISTTEHAQLADWPNGDLSTTRDNGALRTWGTFAAHKPANPLASFKSIVMNRSGEIRLGDELEMRADILRLAGARAYAALGWQDEGLPEVGYALLKGADAIALVKHRFDQGTFAALFWEPLATGDVPVTLVVRFAATEAGLSIEAQVLDRSLGGQVLFTRTVQDTAAQEPVASAPSPLQGTADSGPPWRGSGRVCLSLFGANETTGRLEMDVDNFGLRQVSGVTEGDSAPLTYTHAPNQTLAYRLFAPPERQTGALYPLVLHLHGLEGVGDDNLRQFNRPGFMVFVSPENQSKHPCFLVAPQISTRDFSAASGQYPYTWAAIRQKVTGLLTNLMTEFPIDPDRLYLTGASLGGIGAWSLTTAYPDLFAAAVPIAGLGDTASMRRIAHLPVWAFHGARDNTVAANYSRTLVTELRRVGAAPIYTEYALASHLMFASAFATPGLVDWVLAQRRGAPARVKPWLAVNTPTAGVFWLTSYTNIALAGEASGGLGVTSVTWHNQTLTRSGNAEGTTQWAAVNIPLRTGAATGAGVTPTTNVVTITATGTS
jgi:predicted esterase